MAAILAGIALSFTSNFVSQFDDWAARFGKVYRTEFERLDRLAKWSANMKIVLDHNEEYKQGKHTFNLEMNSLADLSNEEYQRLYLGLNKAGSPSSAANEVQSNFSGIPPATVNWYLDGISGRVKDQGQCGSCWAFSAVATMEGAFNLKNNGSIPSTCTTTCGPHNNPCCEFSEQELVDCTLRGEDTCDWGGEMHDGIMEIVENHAGKINVEAQYKYTGISRGKCRAQDAVAVTTGISGYANVSGVGMPVWPYGNETALMHAIWKQPVVSVAIDASSSKFQLYFSGVFNEPTCKRQNELLDHGVSLIGYGTSLGGEAYWMVKNSWGWQWGMHGYIQMSKDKNNQCGIATDATYALI